MSNRWQGEPSEFPWEREALEHVKALMPERAPYAARQCFKFTGTHGRVWECDLLMATPSGLYLIEIKSHRGRARNLGSTWLFDSGKNIENPLHLTDQKAKELRNRLQVAANKRGWGSVPYIQPIVFLSATDLVCAFDHVQKVGVYGRQDLRQQTGLNEIGRNLILQTPTNGRNRVTPAFSNHLPQLLADIGVAKIRTEVRVGPYTLRPKAFDLGPTWTDYIAENKDFPGDLRRTRVYYSEHGASSDLRESTRRAAQREYRALLGIQHDGIVRVEMYSDELEFGPAVVFRHGKNWLRLTEFLLRYGDDLDLGTRVEMVRQLADALDHAHRNHLYHRALAARSVYVEPPEDGGPPVLRIADWQAAAARRASVPGATLSVSELSGLARHIEAKAGPYLAPEAPDPSAEPAQLDVFGLGVITYLILTGREPAEDRGGLGALLSRNGALAPSAVSDDLPPSADDLVRGATMREAAGRMTDIGEFIEYLDLLEGDLTSPEPIVVPDPLTAVKGDLLGNYEVLRVLGKGASARALLAHDLEEDREVVLKVALPETGLERLQHEAAVLRKCRSSYVVEIYGDPFELGGRHVLALENAGTQTLGDYLRREGRLTIGELEAWAEDLFQMVSFLEQKGIRHRDFKPDNLGVQEGNKKRRQLVLFDFSLAGVPASKVEAGTTAYRDPFLGPPDRMRFDDAAEYYSVAVTLHEMASRQLPVWGDGYGPEFAGDQECPQLAEAEFEDSIRPGLVAFFSKALNRKAHKRFPDLVSFAKAFREVFAAVDQKPPATTARTVGVLPADPGAARRKAREFVRGEDPLRTTGLGDRALALAHERLGVSTVGELAKLDVGLINRLRGEGLKVRNELKSAASEWRRALSLAETAPAVVGQDEDLASASLDRVVAALVPTRDRDKAVLARLLLGLPDGSTPAPVSAWADRDRVARTAGVPAGRVTETWQELTDRWRKTVSPVMTPLRATVVALLNAHGRIMSADALAIALLQARGSDRTDSSTRIAYASACVRAAVEVEQDMEEPRLVFRRTDDGPVVIASVSDDPTQPTEEELFAYAGELSKRATRLIELAETGPLPAASQVLAALGEVRPPAEVARLSDTDLVRLAADITPKVASTPRLELYPVDLDPARIVRLTQLGLLLDSDGGADLEKIQERVRARFPDQTRFPEKPSDLKTLLHDVGLEVEHVEENGSYKLRLKRAERRLSSPSGTHRTSTSAAATPAAEVAARLTRAVSRGGFLAVRMYLRNALPAVERLAQMPHVTAVDVSVEFVRVLREVWREHGETPSWAAVLAADSPTAPAKAKRGIGRLLAEVWPRLDSLVREMPGVVLLHDATPLARYSGGQDLLAALIASARRPDLAPHGLWLSCPMESPYWPARLDGHLVGAVESQGEQVTLKTENLTLNR